jgi:hypothetical protein
LSLFDFGKYDLQNGVRAEFDFLTALKPWRCGLVRLHDIRAQKQGFNCHSSNGPIAHFQNYDADCFDSFTEAFGLIVDGLSGCPSLIQKEQKRLWNRVFLWLKWMPTLKFRVGGWGTVKIARFVTKADSDDQNRCPCLFASEKAIQSSAGRAIHFR